MKPAELDVNVSFFLSFFLHACVDSSSIPAARGSQAPGEEVAEDVGRADRQEASLGFGLDEEEQRAASERTVKSVCMCVCVFVVRERERERERQAVRKKYEPLSSQALLPMLQTVRCGFFTRKPESKAQHFFRRSCRKRCFKRFRTSEKITKIISSASDVQICRRTRNWDLEMRSPAALTFCLSSAAFALTGDHYERGRRMVFFSKKDERRKK